MIVELNGRPLGVARAIAHRFLEQTKGLKRANGTITPRQRKIERQRMRAKIRMTKKLRRALEDAFERMQRAVLERLPGVREDEYSDFKARVESALGVADGSELADELQQAIAEAFEDGVTDALDELKATIAWDITQSKALGALQRQSLQYAMDIVEHQKDGIRAVLKDGIDKGQPFSQIGRNIRDAVANDTVKYTDADGKVVRTMPVDSWAEMVARTEVARAQNQGTLETYRIAGGVDRVVFIATDDDVTCPECEELDGTTLAVGSDDIPPIHPSCRCTVVSSEGYARGAGGSKDDEEED